MAYQCTNSSNQYFTLAALNATAPPITFSMWIKVSSVVNKHTWLYMWRASINTGVLLYYTGSTWELRYYYGGGTQWMVSTGLTVTPGAWQHVCIAISSTQARLYLDGASYTNNDSHGAVNINAAGEVATDSADPVNQTSFNGAIAEAAIWTAALSHDECLALARRVSPLALSNRLQTLVFYKDLVRDVNRGIGAALTAMNGPTVARHPLLIGPRGSQQARLLQFSPPPSVTAPYRVASAVVEVGRVMAGIPTAAGAALGLVRPAGDVSG